MVEVKMTGGEKKYIVFYKTYDKPCFYILSIDARSKREAMGKAKKYIAKNVRNPQEAFIVNAKYGRWFQL